MLCNPEAKILTLRIRLQLHEKQWREITEKYYSYQELIRLSVLGKVETNLAVLYKWFTSVKFNCINRRYRATILFTVGYKTVPAARYTETGNQLEYFMVLIVITRSWAINGLLNDTLMNQKLQSLPFELKNWW